MPYVTLPTLSAPQRVILEELCRFPYLTAEQLVRLHYSRGSLTYIQTAAKELSELGLILRVQPRLRSHGGSLPMAYVLTQKGKRYLGRAGLTPAVFLPPQKAHAFAEHFLTHTLVVNDVLIAAAQLPTKVGWIRVHQLRHELQLKAELRTKVIPDGFVEFRLRLSKGLYQVPVLFEIELGRLGQRQHQVRRKVGELCNFITAFPAYQMPSTFSQVFGLEGQVTIAIVTASGEEYGRQLKTWVERELTERNQQELAENFRVTAASPFNPEHFFCDLVWYQPFEQQPLPLLTRD